MKCKAVAKTEEGKEVKWKTFNAHDKMQVVRVDLPKVNPIFVLSDREAKEIVAMKQSVGVIPNGIYHPLGDNISLCSQDWYDTIQKPKEQRKLINALKRYIAEALACPHRTCPYWNLCKETDYTQCNVFKRVSKLFGWEKHDQKHKNWEKEIPLRNLWQ